MLNRGRESLRETRLGDEITRIEGMVQKRMQNNVFNMAARDDKFSPMAESMRWTAEEKTLRGGSRDYEDTGRKDSSEAHKPPCPMRECPITNLALPTAENIC